MNAVGKAYKLLHRIRNKNKQNNIYFNNKEQENYKKSEGNFEGDIINISFNNNNNNEQINTVNPPKQTPSKSAVKEGATSNETSNKSNNKLGERRAKNIRETKVNYETNVKTSNRMLNEMMGSDCGEQSELVTLNEKINGSNNIVNQTSTKKEPNSPNIDDVSSQQNKKSSIQKDSRKRGKSIERRKAAKNETEEKTGKKGDESAVKIGADLVLKKEGFCKANKGDKMKNKGKINEERNRSRSKSRTHGCGNKGKNTKKTVKNTLDADTTQIKKTKKLSVNLNNTTESDNDRKNVSDVKITERKRNKSIEPKRPQKLYKRLNNNNKSNNNDVLKSRISINQRPRSIAVDAESLSQKKKNAVYNSIITSNFSETMAKRHELYKKKNRFVEEKYDFAPTFFTNKNKQKKIEHTSFLERQEEFERRHKENLGKLIQIEKEKEEQIIKNQQPKTKKKMTRSAFEKQMHKFSEFDRKKNKRLKQLSENLIKKEKERIEKDNILSRKKAKKISQNQINKLIERIYHKDIKRRINRNELLTAKFTPSFVPSINKISNNLVEMRRSASAYGRRRFNNSVNNLISHKNFNMNRSLNNVGLDADENIINTNTNFNTTNFNIYNNSTFNTNFNNFTFTDDYNTINGGNAYPDSNRFTTKPNLENSFRSHLFNKQGTVSFNKETIENNEEKSDRNFYYNNSTPDLDVQHVLRKRLFQQGKL